MTKSKDISYFPIDYSSSRQRFCARTEGLMEPKEVGNWSVPSKTDSDLIVDYVYLRATQSPRILFVVTTGVHGSEAYTGAACLEMFFEEFMPRFDRKETGILLVHAMNPFGYKNHHRCTENHVNLNRNFSVNGSIFNIKNEASKRLCERFLPTEPVSSPISRLIQCMKRVDDKVFFEEISLDDLVKATAPGQFDRPEHMEYGGRQHEPQSVALIEMVRRIMPEYKDVLGLDLHTGLGHRGRLHLLTGGAEAAVHPELLAELFAPDADREFYEFTSPDEEGFYDVYGCLNNVFSDLATPQQRAGGMTLEFGTLGHSFEAQIDGLNRYLIDKQGLFYGFASDVLKEKSRRENFERSYPDDNEWRAMVVRAARGFFERVLTRAGSIS